MSDETPTPDDLNVERLIGEAYRPEPINDDFARRTVARLQRLAAGRRDGDGPHRRILWLVLANAIAIFCLIIGPTFLWRLISEQQQRDKKEPDQNDTTTPPSPDHLTPKPRKAARELTKVLPGKTVETRSDERRAVRLPDDTIVSLNNASRVRLDAERKLTLLAGEVFLQVAPGKTPFVVVAGEREVTVIGTRLSVRIDRQGTGVLVTQGEAKVSGVSEPILAGQALAPGAEKPAAALHAPLELDWTRDLLDEPLVAAGGTVGGLVVRDAEGQEAQLGLRRYHVDVHIEDGFARTTIDQVYFNQAHARLEGTFLFPLPADASLSRLAMYVDGQRMEGGMVEREHGRAVYEGIVRSQRDPALLEWVDGTTFRMRVFPLEPRQEKRIVLSYTQRLPATFGRMSYRFPSGHSLGEVGRWSLKVRVKDGESLAWKCPSHALDAAKEKGDLVLTATAKKVKLENDVVLELRDPAFTGGEQARFVSAEYQGRHYLALRYRPEWPIPASKRPARDWVILFESSAERDPLLARAQVEVVRALLENAERDDTFTLLTANLRTNAITPKPLAASPANVRRAITDLEQTHLIGALDLGRALDETTTRVKGLKNPCVVHVGSGLARLGVREEEKLLERVPAGAVYVGIGVGKRWNRSLMKRAAEKTSGMVVHLNPDEPIAWRTFEMLAMLNAPRLLGVQVRDPAGTLAFLADTTQLAQGEELFAVASTDKGEQDWPKTVTVSGTLDGKPFRRELKLERVRAGAMYLPRTYGRLEIDRLVAAGAESNKQRIVDLSRSLYVMSPFTSLLVLENEEMYTRFKVDRGRRDHWAMYDCPETIPVYHEPADSPPLLLHSGQAGPPAPRRPSAEEVRKTILLRGLAMRFQRETRDPSVRLATVAGRSRVLFDDDPLRRFRERLRFDDIILTNIDLGIDPDVPTNYDINRIEEVSVPGVVDPNAAVGIMGAPEGPPVTIPPPPGSGKGAGGLSDFEEMRWLSASSAGFQTFASLESEVREQLQLAGRSSSSQNRFRFLPLDGRASEDGALAMRSGTRQDVLSLARRDGTSLLSYRRPPVGLGRDLFRDLTVFAPGLNTMPADVRAIVEAEAGRRARPGSVHEKARALIDKGRSLGWHKVSIAARGRDSFDIVCDGAGRYRWERPVALGLREIVVCDGKTLLHLYPEIGLGGSRPVSRYHRADLAAVVPWALPPVEDLALGADLDVSGDNTVVVEPHHGKHRAHLVFNATGRLVEIRWIERPSGKTVSTRKVDEPKPATAPDLKPDTDRLVVLPMPWRTLKQVESAGTGAEQSLALLAATFADTPDRLGRLVKERFLERGDRRAGLYVLRIAAAIPIDTVIVDVPGPLGQYLRRVAPHAKDANKKLIAAPNDFVSRLSALLDLFELTQEPVGMSRDQLDHLFTAVRGAHSPVVLWVLAERFALALPQAQRESPWRGKLFCEVLGELSKALRDVPELGYAAEYEHARALKITGQADAARKAFLDLHARTLAAGRQPLLDAGFPDAVGDQLWRQTMRDAAEHWLSRKDTLAVVALADLCQALGSDTLADELFDRAVEADDRKKMAVIALCCQANRLGRAEKLAQKLLDDPKGKSDAEAWRLAARIAVLQDIPGRVIARLEQALELEWQSRAAGVDVEDVRRDYEVLLAQYQRQVRAAQVLEQKPAEGMVERVRRTVERWRALDPQGPAAERAVDVLLALGERERAWDYLTTALATAEESKPWAERAEVLRQAREFDLAGRCLDQAMAIATRDPAMVLAKAKLLQEAGRRDDSRRTLRRLVDEQWPEKLQEPVEEARRLLGEP